MAARKRELKRAIRRSQLVHLARVADPAARETPELAQKFDLPRVPTTYLPFKTIARTMVGRGSAAEGAADQARPGGAGPRQPHQSLDQFDQAVERGAEGRRVHIGAAANLDVVADEVVQIVRVLDGLNRFRFAGEPNLLAAWTTASNIIGPPRSTERSTAPEAPPSTAEIKPAA